MQKDHGVNTDHSVYTKPKVKIGKSPRWGTNLKKIDPVSGYSPSITYSGSLKSMSISDLVESFKEQKYMSVNDIATGYAQYHILSKDHTEQEKKKALDAYLGLVVKNLGEIDAKVYKALVKPEARSPKEKSQSAQSVKSKRPEGSVMRARKAGHNPRSSGTIDHFQPALGMPIYPPFDELGKNGKDWFVSRKLDGARIIATIDFLVPNEPSAVIVIQDMKLVSRFGTEYSSLGKLKEQLQRLPKYPNLRSILNHDPNNVSETENGPVKRLYLDGELCVLMPKDDTDGNVNHQPSPIWKDTGMRENFSLASGELRTFRTMENPSYFVFDMVTPEDNLGSSTRIFSERKAEMENLLSWLENVVIEQGEDIPRIKPVIQHLVKLDQLDQLDELVKTSTEQGWEGLMFRADALYKPRRSRVEA